MSKSADARDLELIGSVINGRFLIKSRLAAGGMGVVYEAEQIPLGRPVAIKILENKGDHAQEQNFSERFLLEAAAVAKLSHPNTITIFDYGQTEADEFYYAMEFVDGTTLSRRIYEHGPLEAGAAIHVGMQVAGSLREAHRAGMIHRDLKPGNIMLTERLDDPHFVKVLDFGLVKVMGQTDGVELTQSGMLMGSPRYMAPEQVLGHELDARADVYSFGSVLYLALTGFPPFRHGSQFEVLRAQVEEEPPSFAAANPDHGATERLESLVHWCLRKAAADRPASMDEVAQELRLCAQEFGVEEASLSGAVRALPSGSAPISAGMAASDAARVEASLPPQPVLDTGHAGSLDSTQSAIEPRSAIEPSVAGALASPERGSRLPLVLLGLVLVLVAAAAGSAAFFYPFSTEEPEPVATPEPAEVPAVGEADAPRVEIVSEPPGARVRRGDVDLGDAPFSLGIPEGESWELTLTLPGHAPRTVLAASDRDRLAVRLDPVEEPPPVVDELGDTPDDNTPTRPRRPHAAALPPPTPTPLAPAAPITPTPQPLPPVTSTVTPTPPPIRPSPPPTGRQRDLRNPWGQ
ncbi:MAG: serine/threonine protein kinase [Sandaracinaceae bacterium]